MQLLLWILVKTKQYVYMKDIFSVKDKVVIVTGAAKGNGKAIADGFVKAGSIVLYIDILDAVKDNAKLDKTGRSKSYIVDLTNERQVSQSINSIGQVDTLVNNAGISLAPDTKDSHTNWDKTIGINLTSVYELSRLVADIMIQNKGGSIINITSISSYLGSVGNPSYHASKGGVRYLTKSLAADYGKYNIRANNLCPGYINSDMTSESYMDETKRKIVSERTMLGRWGRSNDLVGTCIFLASDASSYITGSDILVDGGLINKGFD